MPYFTVHRTSTTIQTISLLLEAATRDEALEAAGEYAAHPESTDYPEVTLHEMTEPYQEGDQPDDEWEIEETDAPAKAKA